VGWALDAVLFFGNDPGRRSVRVFAAPGRIDVSGASAGPGTIHKTHRPQTPPRRGALPRLLFWLENVDLMSTPPAGSPRHVQRRLFLC
jgi:hypothetical protein